MLTLTVTVHPAIQGYNHLIVVQTIKKELLINNYCNILTDNCCFSSMLLWKILIIILYSLLGYQHSSFFLYFLCRILEALLVGFITTSIAFFGPIYLASCKTLPAVSLFKAPSWQDTRGDKLSNTVLHDNEPETEK